MNWKVWRDYKMNELIQEIMSNINKKGIQRDCKKILKKCSMKSAKDTGFITEFLMQTVKQGQEVGDY